MQNKILQSAPLYPKLHKPIRSRKPDRELSGNFRFAAHNQFERIYDEFTLRSTTGKSPKRLVLEGLQAEKKELLQKKKIRKAQWVPKDDDDTYSSDSSVKEQGAPISKFKSPLKKVHCDSDLNRTYFKAIQESIYLPSKQISKTLDQESVTTAHNRLKSRQQLNDLQRGYHLSPQTGPSTAATLTGSKISQSDRRSQNYREINTS